MLILLSCATREFVQVEPKRFAVTQGKTTIAALDTAANSRPTADFPKPGGFRRQPTPRGREHTADALCVVYPLPSLVIFLVLREPLTLVAIGGMA